MKTTQKIMISLALFTSCMYSGMPLVQAQGLSPVVQKAIETGKKVNEKNEILVKAFNNFMVNIENYNQKIKGNSEKQKTLLTLLQTLDVKLTKYLKKLETPKYKKSIYYGIYKKNFTEFQSRLRVLIASIQKDVTPVTTTQSNTTVVVKVGATDAEKKLITQETINTTLTKAYATGNIPQWQIRDTLVANGKFTELESMVLAMKNYQWDGFEFCANFTSDIYSNNGLRYYQDAQSEVADEYKLFKNTYIPNYWRQGYDKLNENNGRIQKCVAQLNGLYMTRGVDQKFVSALYEKAYGKKFTPWTKPYYQDGTTTKQFEGHVMNIDQYIKNHHGW